MPSERIVFFSAVFACLAAFGCTEETRPPGGVGPAGPGTGAGTNTGGEGGNAGGGMGGDGASGAGAAGAGGPTSYSATFSNVMASNVMETSFTVDWLNITATYQPTVSEVRGTLEDSDCSIILTTLVGGDLLTGGTIDMGSMVDPVVVDPAPGEGFLSYRKICATPPSDHEWRSQSGLVTIDHFDGETVFFSFDALPMAPSALTPNDATGTFDATGSAMNVAFQ